MLGFFTGILPGAGATLSSFLSYTLEKRLSKHPEEFGKGAIEGVAGPESANNAAAGGALIPLLALGIPSSATTSVLMGAFMMYNVAPGPLLFDKHPAVAWGVIASMFLGNVMLLILNMPLVKLFAKLVEVPSKILLPIIVGICIFGIYAVQGKHLQPLYHAPLRRGGILPRRQTISPRRLWYLAAFSDPCSKTTSEEH